MSRSGPIHWASTETADEWTGYFDGAVRSGRRAAAEVPCYELIRGPGRARCRSVAPGWLFTSWCVQLEQWPPGGSAGPTTLGAVRSAGWLIGVGVDRTPPITRVGTVDIQVECADLLPRRASSRSRRLANVWVNRSLDRSRGAGVRVSDRSVGDACRQGPLAAGSGNRRTCCGLRRPAPEPGTTRVAPTAVSPCAQVAGGGVDQRWRPCGNGLCSGGPTRRQW